MTTVSPNPKAVPLPKVPKSLRLPSAIDVPPQLVDFRQPRRSFVLHNARVKPVEVMFIGNLMTVPPVHLVGPHSDTDADGGPIPGTYVVEDHFVDIPEFGEEILILDSARAVRHILGLQKGPDGKAAAAVSSYALAGMSLLPRHATKEQWKEAATHGEQRAFLAEVERARYVVENIDHTNEIRKANGMSTIAGGREYQRAAFILGEYNKLVEQEAGEVMAPHQEDALDEDIEMDAYVHAQAIEIAGRVAEAKGVDKAKLAEELLKDPSVRQKLQKKYRIRKRGRNERTDEELAAAVAAGKADVDEGSGNGDEESDE